MNNRFKTAIIGCGGISLTHITALQAIDNADIVAICDVREDRLENAAKLCPEAVRYTDYKKLLAESDAQIIHICTPHYLHAEMAIASMLSGRDVYLEKPCAMNRAQAQEIIDVSDKTGKKVCVSFQNRLINTTASAKAIAESGELGKVVGGKGFVTWNRGGAYYTESGWRGQFATEGGGVLMNQSIHTLDLLYYFLGEVESVKGHASLDKNFDVTEVEDTAQAYIKFKNGSTAIFYATNCNVLNSTVEIELYFEKGSLLFRDDALYRCENGKIDLVCKNDNLLNGKNYWGNGHIKMISNFYDAVSGNDTYYCDIRDAVQVLEIIAGIYKGSEIRPENI